MVAAAGEWGWSSAWAHLREVEPVWWLDLADWRRAYTPEQWRVALGTSVAEEAETERIREATRTGRPLGAKGFVREMEERLQRRLIAGKPGRPRSRIEEGVPEGLSCQEEIGI